MAVGGLTFVTGIRYAEGMLKAVHSLTFVYDATWEATNEKVTFPIAFFGIKNIKENNVSEVQTKKMLFYNSQSESNASVTTGSILNVVADNIVNKPKTYQMEIIVPDVTTGMIFSNPYAQPYQLVGVWTANSDSETRNGCGIAMFSINMILDVLSLVTGVSPSSSVIKVLTDAVGNKPKYNKDSLTYMWENRKVLKLKLWNDWKFKYVVISDLSFSKIATEDNYETASVTFTEIPMAIMYPNKELTKKRKSFFVKWGSWIGTAIGKIFDTE